MNFDGLVAQIWNLLPFFEEKTVSVSETIFHAEHQKTNLDQCHFPCVNMAFACRH